MKHIICLSQHTQLSLLLIFTLSWNSYTYSQPLTNPSGFGKGSDLLGVIGVLFFSCPLIWALFSSIGDSLSEKASSRFWIIFWTKHFVTIGVISWVAFILYVFCL